MIKNVSFDVWGTILKSNPRYRSLRANFIRTKYKMSDSADQIEKVLMRTGDLIDNVDRKMGSTMNVYERYKAAYNNLGLGDGGLKDDVKEIDNIFLDNLPYFFDGDTVGIINRIKRRVSTLSVISNTGYADGYLMREALTHLGVADKFDHMIFSDEVGCCKPNKGIFEEWASRVAENGVVNVNTLLHVGDDKEADYEGPKALKMESFLINGKTGRNIKSVITFLDGKL